MSQIAAESRAAKGLAERPIHSSEAADRALFRFMRDAVFEVDGETGMIIDANPAAEALIDRPLSDIQTLQHWQLHPSDEHEEARQAFADFVRNSGDTRSQQRAREWNVVHRDGRIIPVDILATVSPGADGRPAVVAIFRDVSEHRKAAQALRRSEERFRQVAENAGDFIWEIDPDGLYTYASPVAERILGYTSEEIVGKMHFYDFFVPEMRAEMRQAAFELIARRAPFRAFLNFNVRKDGETVALETSGVPIYGGNGAFLGYRGADRDITERRRTDALLHAILECSPDRIFVKDRDSRLLLANPATLAAFQKSADEVLGKTDEELYADPAVGRQMMANDRRVMELGQTQFVEEVVPSPTGLRTFVSAQTPYRDAQGRVIGVIGIARDVTEREAVAQAMKDSEARFRATFMNIVIASYIATLEEGRILEINDAFVPLFGYSREEVIGKTSTELHMYANPAVRAKVVAELKANGRVVGFEITAKKKGGAEFTAWLNIVAFKLGGEWHIAGAVEDITERKQAELAVRASEQKYRRLHESISDAVVTVDMAGHILEFNPAYQTMLGYTGEELRKLRYQDLTPERWHDFEAQIIADQVIPKGHSEIYEKEYRRRDGTTFPIELRTYLLRDEAGEPAGMWAIIRDVTERKHREEELRDSERRFRSLFDYGFDATFWTNTNGSIQAANSAACAMLGMTEQEVCSAGRDGFMVQDERLREAIETRRLNGRVQRELSFLRKDGTTGDGEVASMVLDEGGQAFVIMRDITERKRAEQALRISEERFAKLFECSPVSITLSDLNDRDRIIEVNGAFENFTGLRREDALGRRDRDWLFADPVEYQQAVSQFTECGKLSNFEFRFRRQDGENRIGLLSAENIEVGGKPCVLATTIDITERRRAEEERERLQQQLAHSQRMECVGRLAGGVAHDFNNLMSAVLMNADSALDEVGSGSPASESVMAIRDAAEKAVAVGRQLMVFSSKQPLQTELLDVNAVVGENHKLLRRLIGEDVKVIFKPGSGLGFVKADRGQLGQIIVNLAVNSRDAMPQGGTFTIETAAVELDKRDAALDPDAKPGSYVAIAVRDTGVGMDKDTQARAFEPFFTTKGVGKGTGLGLSVVYGIVKQTGGFLTIASGPGEGTEFRIYLPAVHETAAPILETEAGPVRGGSETILLVEDELALREKVREVLDKIGYRVLVAPDGSQALRLALEEVHPIHLLLTDVIMPEMSGPRLSERLSAIRPGTRVLYMSGYPDAGDRLAVPSGPNFLQKPFTKEKLLRRIRKLLDS